MCVLKLTRGAAFSHAALFAKSRESQGVWTASRPARPAPRPLLCPPRALLGGPWLSVCRCVRHVCCLLSHLLLLLCVCVCSVTQSCPALWPHGLWPARHPCPRDSPDKKSGVGCPFFLQVSVPTQAWKWLLPHLLRCRRIPYPWPLWKATRSLEGPWFQFSWMSQLLYCDHSRKPPIQTVCREKLRLIHFTC